MKLFYRKIGQGKPFIILHGLYGSSDNWVSIARELSSYFEIWLIDIRNHGKSPHSPEHNYQLMVDDLYEFMNEHNLSNSILLGHSMGGKIAMHFAYSYPDLLSHLIVVDIAPKSYLFSLEIQSDTLNHKQIMESMLATDFSGIKKREEIEAILAQTIKDERIRQFLMKNIKRNHDLSFGWTLNIDALYKNIENILAEFKPLNPKAVNNFTVLFLKGSESEYIQDSDFEEIHRLFPKTRIDAIPDAGHWIHADAPNLLVQKLLEFINNNRF